MSGVLVGGVVYLALDAFVCASCAGYTAAQTGRTIGGKRLRPVTRDMAAHWSTLDLGPLTCECGKVTAA